MTIQYKLFSVLVKYSCLNQKNSFFNIILALEIVKYADLSIHN